MTMTLGFRDLLVRCGSYVQIKIKPQPLTFTFSLGGSAIDTEVLFSGFLFLFQGFSLGGGAS